MKPTKRNVVADEDKAAPVTILDGSGRVIEIIEAKEFRRIHGVPELPSTGVSRRRMSVKTEPAKDTLEHAVAG
jgi:hypothetical protein